MDHALPVRVVQRVRRLAQVADADLLAELRRLREDLAEAGPGHEGHREEAESGALGHLVDGHDVGVAQLARGAGLALEAPNHTRVLGELGRQDLQRHPALQGQLLGQEHAPHPPTSQLADDLELAGGGGAQSVQQACRIGSGRRQQVIDHAVPDRCTAAGTDIGPIGQRRLTVRAGGHVPPRLSGSRRRVEEPSGSTGREPRKLPRPQ